MKVPCEISKFVIVRVAGDHGDGPVGIERTHNTSLDEDNNFILLCVH